MSETHTHTLISCSRSCALPEMSGVTLIDLEPFRLGSSSDRADVANQIDRACQDTGFLQVVGHGVPEHLSTRMLDVTAAFFDRPLEEKMALILEDRSANRGYAAEGTEALAYSLGETGLAPDLFEAFNAGRDDVDPAYVADHAGFFAPNVWPNGEMRIVWTEYLAAVGQLNDHLMTAFAIALDIDPAHFIDRTRRAIVTLRAINYERRAKAPAPLPNQMRMGAHTDYGVLTVLLADDVPGLQVRTGEAWHDVAIPDGSLIVNIGDMLATWTNDRWRSTLHRVVPPPVGMNGAVRRRSVAQFVEADPGVILEPITTCVSESNPARYAPVSAGDYLMAKLLGPRELRPSEIPTSG